SGSSAVSIRLQMPLTPRRTAARWSWMYAKPFGAARCALPLRSKRGSAGRKRLRVASSKETAAPYTPRDQLFLWLLTQPRQPVLIGTLSMLRASRGVSLRYADDWLERGFALSEDLP